MKKRHAFHCQTCSSKIEIFKKGKKHRVLVCPRCGVLATNPFPLLVPLATGALSAAGGMIATKALSKKDDATPTAHASDNCSHRFTTEDRVRMALGRV